MIKITQNSLLPDVSLALEDEDDEVIDLTSASKVVLNLVGESVTISGNCIIDDAVGGLVHRPWIAGDTAVLGLYQLWAEIFWGDRTRVWPCSDVEFALILPAISGTPPPPPPTRAYSVFGEISGIYVPLVSSTWVTLFEVGNLSMAHQIKALTLALDGIPDNPVFRITGCPTGSSMTKVFPFSSSDPLVETEIIMDELINIPKAYDYAIQVFCDNANGADAKVASLKRIELNGTEEPALTTFTEVEGTATLFVDTTWTTVYSEVSIANDLVIKSVRLDNSDGIPGLPSFRIRAKESGSVFEKVFPFGSNTPIVDNHEFILDEVVQVPQGADFEIQVYCSTANGAKAKAYLKKIIK